jgi:hypothetical protein
VTRPAAVIEEELAGLRQNRLWASSQECRDATASASRQFCAGYSAARAEKEKAVAAAELEAEITRLRERLNTFAAVTTMDKNGDPRAGFLSRLLGQPIFAVQTWLSVVLIVTIEIMSTFGVFISLRHSEFRGAVRGASDASREGSARTAAAAPHAAPAVVVMKPPRKKVEAVIEDKREVGDIRVFVLERMQPKDGESVVVADLYPVYSSWCRERSFRAVGEETFADLFEKLCALTGFVIERGEGRVTARNLRLAA